MSSALAGAKRREGVSVKRYVMFHLIPYFVAIWFTTTFYPASLYIGQSSSTAIHYITRGWKDFIPSFFERHFNHFCNQHEELYPKEYGMFRLDRIQEIEERFCTWGDFMEGVARIRCTNPECGYDYFRRGRPARTAAGGFTYVRDAARNERCCLRSTSQKKCCWLTCVCLRK